MTDWRMALVRRWRTRNEARAHTRVLVLGDSHVRVFEHWWFLWALPRVRWHIVYVAGGTATGLPNPQSATRARTRFDEALAGPPSDLVVINLGEVDTGYTIWARAERNGSDPRAAMAQAVQRYAAFITEVARQHRVVVVGAPLPTLPDDFVPGDDVGSTRKSVIHSQTKRTELTLAFNASVAAACAELGVPHLDDRADSLGADGKVKASWQRTDRADHHYDRKTYARWLARALHPHLPAPRR
ncbi:MAG: SGNH/GDSL hydrolase family protein [Hydrogenophaga sp.]|uniref:SGNH/GDSL hydrolase family protein n=1 Tax=Hydrogenophaga sp. TaxID=1904254 RepID=UPI00260BCFD6|nr:SGNH/GDSL hydrolase family protein [Hydrogenophaga sp.]MDM7942116.1 SGNH/GDSL hydrolase family protein [Hydrogenophaga sp.]